MAAYGTINEKAYELQSFREHTVVVSGGAPPSSVSDAKLAGGGQHHYLQDKFEGKDEAAWLFDAEARDKEQGKWKKLIGVGADKVRSTGKAEGCAVCLDKSAPCLAWTVVGCEACVPLYIKVARCVYSALSVLPQEELCVIGGALLVFFGGTVWAVGSAWK